MTALQRRVEYVALDDLQPAQRNPKQHDTEGIARSISRFGIIDLPTVDERTGRLVAGHGRREDWLARRERGENPPDGVRLADDGTWMVPAVYGWSSRSDEEAEAAGAALNHLTETGGWDQLGLVEMLASLAKVDPDLVLAAGWTEAESMAMIAKANGADQVAPDEFPSYDDATIATEFTCPSCGYQWSGTAGQA